MTWNELLNPVNWIIPSIMLFLAMLLREALERWFPSMFDRYRYRKRRREEESRPRAREVAGDPVLLIEEHTQLILCALYVALAVVVGVGVESAAYSAPAAPTAVRASLALLALGLVLLGALGWRAFRQRRAFLRLVLEENARRKSQLADPEYQGKQQEKERRRQVEVLNSHAELLREIVRSAAEDSGKGSRS